MRARRIAATRSLSDGALVGVVDRELLSRLEPEGLRESAAALFKDRPPELATPAETCRAVASRMAAFGLERLPVGGVGRSRGSSASSRAAIC